MTVKDSLSQYKSLFLDRFYRDNVHLTTSIQRHLMLMFNTRKGSVPGDNSYGMPDLRSIYHQLPSSCYQLQQSMLQLINKYEPRLADISIDMVNETSSEQVLCFNISAMVVMLNSRIKITANYLENGACHIERLDNAAVS